MSRTLYLRNLVVFSIFVAIIFATPFLFAESSSHNYIRLNNFEGYFHNRDDQSVQDDLTPGTVLQIPDSMVPFIKRYENGAINLEATLKEWEIRAEAGDTLGLRNGNFPVRVKHHPETDFDTRSRTSIGFFDLADLAKNPSAYSTVDSNLSNPIGKPDERATESPIMNDPRFEALPDVYGSYQIVDNDDGLFSDATAPSDATVPDEVTVPDPVPVEVPIPTPAPPRPSLAPDRSLRPPARPVTGQVSRPPSQASSQVFNCNNTYSDYRTTRQNYARSSCLRNMEEHERAQLVLNDVMRINQLREGFSVDPRFSLCIAYRESRMHPNAKGGTPDWGMYQVIDSTGEWVLSQNQPVISEFVQYRRNWEQYKRNMIRSTLAQADLHHMVLFQIAKRSSSRVARFRNGTASDSDYRRLTEGYNRSSVYQNKIMSCFGAIKSSVSRDGRILNRTNMINALQRAL